MIEMSLEFIQSIVGELELTRRAQAARIAELEAAVTPAVQTPSGDYEGDHAVPVIPRR